MSRIPYVSFTPPWWYPWMWLHISVMDNGLCVSLCGVGIEWQYEDAC